MRERDRQGEKDPVYPLLLMDQWVCVDDWFPSGFDDSIVAELGRAGLEAKANRGGSKVGIWVRRNHQVDLALRLADRLVESYELVCEGAEREGITIRPYKPLERWRILVAMYQVVGLDPASEAFFTGLLHEAVWAQGLPNANHRSTLLLVSALMEEQGLGPPDDDTVQAVGERFA